MTVGMDETLNWFKQQTGAKRIELICRLLGTCIPLELRFFESFIQEKCKLHSNSLRESELKANAFSEIDNICKCDLLHEGLDGFEDPPEVNGTVGPGGAANATTAGQDNPVGNPGSGATSPGSTAGSNTGSTTTAPGCLLPNQLPSRSRMIISLCLLQSPNPRCSSLIFETIQAQLTPFNVNNAINFHLIPKNYPLDKFFSEIRLMMTMAIHHPAFTYEQQDLLMTQMMDLERMMQLFETNVLRLSHQPQHNSSQAGTSNPFPGQPQQAVPSSHTQQSVTGSGHTLYAPPPSYQTSSGKQHHPMSGQPYTQLSFLTTGHHHGGPAPSHPHHTVPMYATGSNPILAPMALLKVSQPPQSSSPSPTLSPSSTAGSTGTTSGNPSTGGGKQSTPVAPVVPPAPPTVPSTSQASSISPLGPVKIEHASPLYGSTAPPPPNTMIFVTNEGVAPSQISGFFPAPPLLVANTGQVPEAVETAPTSLKPPIIPSCYNCGGLGHRGNECSTVGGEEAH